MIQNTATPVVSVIVPMYKVEEYLKECLDSVLNQTLKDIEIICVDDGSPDRSGEIAAQYAEKYSCVKVLTKENGGLSSARNAGMDAATGRYLYFLDSDDYIAPDTLKALCDKADKDNLDIVYFNTHLLFESSKVRELNQNYVDYYTRKHDYPGIHTGQSLFAMMRSHREFFPSVCLQLFRRSLIEENHLRFYNGIIHEDNLFSFQCMILAQRVSYDSRSFYYRRMHGDSIMTASKSIRNVEGYLVTYAEILAFMRGREVEEAAFEHVSEFLYTSIWGNGRRIFRDLDIPEESAALSHGDFCAAHFLDMVKRSGETEFDRSRLKNENTQLKLKLRRLEKSTRFSILRKLGDGIQCVKDHGLMYTIRRGFGKIFGIFRKIDRMLCRIKPYHFLTRLPKRLLGSGQNVQAALPAGPLVSIILPVYNVETFIDQGIQSLLNQTLKQIEIIAVDDGSTDSTPEILNRYAAQDSRLRVFTQQNQYAGAARNLGLANATGEYVIFLDSDDFFAETLAEDAYNAAKPVNADVVLFGAKHYHNGTGEFREAKWLLNASLAPAKQPFCYKDCPDTLYRITTPAPWTKMFRREFVQSANLQFQRIQNANDLFFTYSALAMAKRIVTVDKALVYYRVGLETNLQSTKKKHPFCFYEAYRAWHDKLAELGTLDLLRRSYVNVALSGCMHNLRSNNDPEVKRAVFTRLKEEILQALEIPGHAANYYISRENYEDMCKILSGSFEDYVGKPIQEQAAVCAAETVPTLQITQSAEPVISIVMPVYNAQAYLPETIRSIQAQTLEAFEVICVDDGSTDQSVQILQETVAADSRFRIVHQENGGAGAARNYGFTFARGKYTIFLDSDDLFSPQLLEKLYQAITEQNADIAACNFSKLWPNGKVTQHEGVHTRWIPEGLKVFSYRDLPDYIMRVINPTPWNKLYRSAFIREHDLKFEPISSTNDITFASVSVARAERVTYILDSLVQYRTARPDSISSGKHKKLHNNQIAVESAERQARALPYSDVINNAILSFVVDNYIVSLSAHIKDFFAPEAKEFYQMVHETFNRHEFDNVDPRTLHNPKQYREFCTVRKHDYEAMKQLISRRLIVSLTTYPRRIGTIPLVLESLYAQTRKADEIILWLADSQFPNGERDLPEELLQLVEEKRLTIRWCEDLKPHKKYFYALQEYKDDIVVTVDDDLLYSSNMLSSLYDSYLLYPEAVSTVRAHLVILSEQKEIMPYKTWVQETDICIHKPSMQLMATGGAGVLYPPHLFRKEFFDEKAIMQVCPWADDLWLKAMQLVSDVPVVVAREHEPLQYIPDSQEEALHLVNVSQNQNDVQLGNISRWLDETFEPGILVRKLTEDTPGEAILGMMAVTHHIDEERKALRRKIGPTSLKLIQEEAKRKQAEAQQRQAESKQRQAESRQRNAENKQRQAETKQRDAEEKLRDTRKKLREAIDSKPHCVQLRILGKALHQQRKKGFSPMLLFKYLVYYTAWIPAKILAFLMYYLQNGAKYTLMHFRDRLSGR